MYQNILSWSPIRLEPNISKTAGLASCYLETIANYYIDSLLWGGTVGYPSDSLASCFLSCCILYVLDHILCYYIRFLDVENKIMLRQQS